MTTYRQWSSVSVTLHTHDESAYREGERSLFASPLVSSFTPPFRVERARTGIDSRDVIQCSVSKRLDQPAGGFQLTLVPRQEYLDSLQVDDWVEIRATAGGVEAPIMLGSIDTISRSRSADARGAVSEVIQVQGRDYGKVFLSILLITDPVLGPLLEGVYFNSKVLLRPGEEVPFANPSQVVEAILKNYHNNRAQCLLPRSLEKKRVLHTHLLATEGFSVLRGNPNLSGTLWGTMEQYINPILNEMWVDTDSDGGPVLNLEERPYSHDAFHELPSFTVMADEVTRETLSKGSGDIRNWFRVYPDAQFISSDVVNILRIGLFNSASIVRSGLRRLEPTTASFGDFKDVLQAEGLVSRWSAKIAEWNAVNEALLSGTMSLRFRPELRVGRRLDYSNERTGEELSFYIEGVNHSFSYPRGGTTEVTLSRGVRREAGTFPLLVQGPQGLTKFSALAPGKPDEKTPTQFLSLRGGQLA